VSKNKNPLAMLASVFFPLTDSSSSSIPSCFLTWLVKIQKNLVHIPELSIIVVCFLSETKHTAANAHLFD
jgi:hypothetical protein